MSWGPLPRTPGSPSPDGAAGSRPTHEPGTDAVPPTEPYIDAHSHVWTPDVGHFPLAEGFKVADMAPKSFTAEELLKICRPAGVGRVNLIQMSFYVGSGQSSGFGNGFDNRYMVDMIKLYPDRFVGTAIVDPLGADPGKAMEELRPSGARAFRIHPRYSKLPPTRCLEPDGYKAMFATAARTGQPLSCLIEPDGFAESGRMCRLYPTSKVNIDHLGRVGGGRDGVIRDAEVDGLCALAKNPKIFVKVGAFYALGKKTP